MNLLVFASTTIKIHCFAYLCEMFSSTGVDSGITAVAAARESYGCCSNTLKCQHLKHRQLFPSRLPLAICSFWCFFSPLRKQLLEEANCSFSCYSFQVHSHKFHKCSTLMFILAKLSSSQCIKLCSPALSLNCHFPISFSWEKNPTQSREEAIVKPNTLGLFLPPAACTTAAHFWILW